MTAVAVLGLGTMGAGLATNLAADGHEVTVWNRTPQVATDLAATVAVRVAQTPAEAAAGAAVVLAMVRDDEASRAVWLDPRGGAAAGMGADAVAVESSTLSPTWVRELAGLLPGVALVEAPVLGSRPAVAARSLLVLAGGDAVTVERVRPVLEASASSVRHVGALGTAATLKLLANTVLSVQVAAWAEVVAAVRADAHLDEDSALALLTGLPVAAPAMGRMVGLMRGGDFTPNFAADLVGKDLGYAAGLLGPHAPMRTAAAGVFAAATAAGLGGDDLTGVVRLYLPEAGPA